MRSKHGPETNSDCCHGQLKDQKNLINFPLIFPFFRSQRHNTLTMAEKGGQQVSFSFQIGLMKDKITVDSTDLTLKYLKTLALSFVNEKFPENGISRLVERLMVFKHDYTAENVLQVELS